MPRMAHKSEEFDPEEPPTFREVMAYLDGVADAMTATKHGARPVALAPCSTPSATTPTPYPVAPGSAVASGTGRACEEPGAPASSNRSGRLTLRYGEHGIALEYLSLFPHPAPATTSVTRGGARLLDLGGGDGASSPGSGLSQRDTLPYSAVTLSLAPTTIAPAVWAEAPIRLASSTPPTRARVLEEERTSNVYLRCARLSSEWYDLTGTDRERK